LVYTDPDGEFYIIDDWVRGFIKGFVGSWFGKNEPGHHTWVGNGFASANREAWNAVKIWGGLFATDANKTFGGKVWEVASRFTWQLPQTVGGFVSAHAANTFGYMNWVQYKYGATVMQTSGRWGGMTQGSFILGDESIEADANNPLFQHEYGHYLQSRKAGWLYYPKYDLPSLNNSIKHEYIEHSAFWVEQDANIRANQYFNNNIKDYNGWSYKFNPIFNSGNNIFFDQNYGYLQTNIGTVNPKWWEYIITFGGLYTPGWLIIYSLNINKGQ